jgi:demethylmenaquinone methyltransferase/2-methoxy-6-polyprenyl-1,4-benzoquinol methylase
VTAGLPEGDAKARAVRSMFDAIAPRYDLVNRIMTFRMDVGWRRRAIAALDLGPSAVVVDLACGTGDLCRDLHRAGYRPIGTDISLGMLAHAATDAPLVQSDAVALPIPSSSVDGAVSGFALRNFVALEPVFDELARVVRPGGRIALLDVATPPNPVLRIGHHLYFTELVPRIGGLLSDPEAYRYLPRSVAYLPPAPVMVDRLRTAGFGSVERRLLSGGIAQLLVATRRVETAAEKSAR